MALWAALGPLPTRPNRAKLLLSVFQCFSQSRDEFKSLDWDINWIGLALSVWRRCWAEPICIWIFPVWFQLSQTWIISHIPTIHFRMLRTSRRLPKARNTSTSEKKNVEKEMKTTNPFRSAHIQSWICCFRYVFGAHCADLFFWRYLAQWRDNVRPMAIHLP